MIHNVTNRMRECNNTSKGVEERAGVLFGSATKKTCFARAQGHVQRFPPASSVLVVATI